MGVGHKTLEKNLWTSLKDKLPAGCHAVRIENSAELGTPDVNVCLPAGKTNVKGRDIWIELKTAALPKRESTKVSVKHFTMEQRTWLHERHKAGGECYVLVQVGSSYALLRGDIAAVVLGSVSFEGLCESALVHSDRLLDVVNELCY